ncbi:MAG: glycosyltransferase family 39 protein [Oscillatoriales cyanobacterium RM2_1_1]|nr:glycosyltransferase family 39 protein [Oscillatoriales cyanobacterium SM2_3_0]NJO47378.1 glycosyltransferase family 39 protein [Oscillatoriales cyanobacterium RM2_1_1]
MVRLSRTYFKPSPRITWLISGGGLLLITGLGFLWNLGSTGLVDETEPLFAEAARQMTLTWDWVTPYFNGETRFDKPPLIYWLMAISYRLIGVNSWAVRLPSALAAIALTVGCFLALKHFGPGSNSPHAQSQSTMAAWLAAIMVTFNPETLAWARQGVSDMVLSGCLGTGLLCFFWGYVREGRRSGKRDWMAQGSTLQDALPNWGYLGFYGLISLAVLTKGPVGLVLPGLILGSFLIYTGNFWKVIWEMRPITGSLIFLTITVPWFVVVIVRNGQTYIDAFFGYHNFERFTQVVNEHGAPWYFYFLVVLVGFFPWSAYLPLALSRLNLQDISKWRACDRAEQLGIFACFWLICIFGFFSISVTKLPSYVLPLMPAGGILVALLWSEILTDSKITRLSPRTCLGLWGSGLFNILLLGTLSAVCFWSPELVSTDPAVVDLPEVVKQSGLPIRGGIIWLVMAVVVAALLQQSRRWRWIIMVNFVGFVVFFISVIHPALFLVDQVRQLPLRTLSTQVAQVEKPGEELLMIGFKKPSVAFYSQRHVNFFDVRSFFKIAPGRPLYYLYDSIQNRPQPPTVLAISRPKDLQKIGLKSSDFQVINQQGRYQLIRVHKQIIIDRIRRG